MVLLPFDEKFFWHKNFCECLKSNILEALKSKKIHKNFFAMKISCYRLVTINSYFSSIHPLLLLLLLLPLSHTKRETVELAKRCESIGVSWITVHGRTVKQRAEPVNLDAIKLVKENVGIPVVANGDMKNESDIKRTVQETRADGVMAARGMLQNPAMFAGFDETPLECLQDWVDIALGTGLTFTSFHHHCMYMLERIMAKTERRVFNTLNSTPGVLEFLKQNYDIQYKK